MFAPKFGQVPPERSPQGQCYLREFERRRLSPHQEGLSPGRLQEPQGRASRATDAAARRFSHDPGPNGLGNRSGLLVRSQVKLVNDSARLGGPSLATQQVAPRGCYSQRPGGDSACAGRFDAILTRTRQLQE